MFYKELAECTTNPSYRPKFNSFLAEKNSPLLPHSQKLVYISVDQYTFGQDVELITSGLNYCIGLGISFNDKVFLAHISKDKDSLIQNTVNRIRKEFGAAKLNPDNIKLKIWLGAANESSSAVFTVLKLLFELDLLLPFIQNLQQYISNNLEQFADVMLKKWQMTVYKYYFFKEELTINVDKFLAIKNIKKEFEIKLVAEFINQIKNKFKNVSFGCALEKIEFESFAATCELRALRQPLNYILKK